MTTPVPLQTLRADTSTSAGRLLLVAVAAITLGLAIQSVILVTRWGVFTPSPATKAIADILSGLTWSTFVCTGLAAGAALNRYRASVMGLAGLLMAPLGFALAKGVQKGLGALSGADPETLTTVAIQIGALKAMEYALLGCALAVLARRNAGGLATHAVVGLGFGLTFGAAMLAVELSHPPVAAARMTALLINELVFPVGCASILYAVGKLADRSQNQAPTAPS
jgi:hypothetical protein